MFLQRLTISREIMLLPRWLLLPLISLALRADRKKLKPNEVSLEALIPTQYFDMQLVKEMNGSLEHFAALRAEVFLLGGAKSPLFLHEILDALNQTLPHVERIEYPDLDHSGPNETAPERIADDLRAFFSRP